MHRMIAIQVKMKVQSLMMVRHRFGGMQGIRVKEKAGCGITEILKAGCKMKMQGRHRDKPHFEGAIQEKDGYT